MKLVIEYGQHLAAERALDRVYQGDLAGARAECWTRGAKLAVFASNPSRGAELWPDLVAEWQRMSA